MMHFRVRASHVSDFIMWSLNADHAYQQVRQDTVGATSPRVNIPTIANLWLAMPPRAEQLEVAGYVASGVSGLDVLCAKVRRHIGVLREYRQTLISAAVTGKLAIPEPSEAA